ncbi:MAG: glycosyltransferase family 2 protein [Acidobacteriota bacterium]
MTSPLVSVIVVNHNRADLLRECLRSLLAQSYPKLEVWIIDNGSTDRSAETVKSFTDKRIRFCPLGKNLGFARANNFAIRQARGQLIALLNNDAMAAPDWIEKLVSAIRTSPGAGMCASKILFHDTAIIDKAGHLMYPDGQNRGRGTGEQDLGQYDQPEEGFFADGCAALYRKQMLEEVAGFDEDFFAYGEDADLGVRGQWLGWKCLYVPEAVVFHRHSSTSGRFSAQKIYWVERNRFWLAVKNLPLPLLILSPLWTLYRWIWNVAAALMGRGAAGQFRRGDSLWSLAAALLKAYWDGFRLLGVMLRKRRSIRRSRRISDPEFYRLLLRFRISARLLAFRDTNF